MITERRLRTPIDLDRLDYSKLDGLVTCVVQDAGSGNVLMVAFANRRALGATLESGEVHFWSRSRNELWRKGATSGNTLRLVSLHTDCDADTVLVLAVPAGPACHTGTETCFGDEAMPVADALRALDRTLAKRADERPEGSYTVQLLEDRNLRLKKLGEESAELVVALATADRASGVEEAADLIYHVLVALRAEGLGLGDVLSALGRRAH